MRLNSFSFDVFDLLIIGILVYVWMKYLYFLFDIGGDNCLG